jgi:hypothetical protein
MLVPDAENYLVEIWRKNSDQEAYEHLFKYCIKKHRRKKEEYEALGISPGLLEEAFRESHENALRDFDKTKETSYSYWFGRRVNSHIENYLYRQIKNENNDSAYDLLINICRNKLMYSLIDMINQGFNKQDVEVDLFQNSFNLAYVTFKEGESFSNWVNKKFLGEKNKFFKSFGIDDDVRRIRPWVIEARKSLHQELGKEPTHAQINARVYEMIFNSPGMDRVKKWSKERWDKAIGTAINISNTISLDEIVEDENDIPLPSPENEKINRENLRDLYERFFMVLLGEESKENAIKMLILITFKEVFPRKELGTEKTISKRKIEKTAWEEIAISLDDPDHYLGGEYFNVLTECQLGSYFPSTWKEVCKLFETPPPNLFGNDLKRRIRSISQFYTRGMDIFLHEYNSTELHDIHANLTAL